MAANTPKTETGQIPDADRARQLEIRELARLAKKYMWDTPARRDLQAFNVMIEPKRFYSQLPSLDDIGGSFEYAELHAEKGVWWDDTLYELDHVRDFLDAAQGFADEFDPPLEGNLKQPDGFFWANPAFSYCDAMAYWCNIRLHRPDHIIEIGSGFSTLVAAAALKANGTGRLSCIEPFPPAWLREAVPDMTLIETPIQDMSATRFNALFRDGDMLMIDSTHTVKIGSDCLWIYLKLLPALTSDLFIHVHDIFLPGPPNLYRAVDKRINWVESYLLMAYLLDNPRTDVYFGSKLVLDHLPDLGARFMGGKRAVGGASFWFTQKARP